MKGMVFNLLEDFIVAGHGQDTFEKIYKNTNLITKDPFIGPQVYPDEDFLALVSTACTELSLPVEAAVREFGKFCFPKLIEVDESFTKTTSSTLDFLKTVHGIIHVEVKKLHPDAELPAFSYSDLNNNTLVMEYRSTKKLCFFAEGLIDSCASYFGESVKISQGKCHHKGDQYCEIYVELQAHE